MIKTKAAVLFRLNESLKIIEFNLPNPKKGEILVKIYASGICHTQLLEIQGKNATGSHCPNLMGHEGSGIVYSVGPNVTKVKKGDHVVLSWIKGRGNNVMPKPIKYKKKIINRGPVTTFSEYSVVSENRVTKINKKMPLKLAALLGCAVPTGMGMVFNNAKLKKNSTLLCFGCGGIGINAIHAAQISNAKIIVGVDKNDDKLIQAKYFGATHIINPTKENLSKKIMQITKNYGLDYAIDTVGNKETMEFVYDHVNKNNGKAILCGVPNPIGLKINIDPFPLYYGKKISGTGGGETNTDKDLPKYCKMYFEKKLFLDEMISHRFSLREINKGIDLMKKGKCLRVLIDMETN